MPPRRRPQRRAKKSSRWQIYGRATRQLAMDAAKGVRFVKQLVNTEFDYNDSSFNGAMAPGTAPTIVLLNGLTQGDTASSREGNSIRMKSIQLKVQTWANTLGGTNQQGRFMLVQDTQPNGAIFTLTQLLQGNTTNTFRNLDGRTRFRILFDRTISFSQQEGTVRNFAFYKKAMQTHVTYFNASNAGTIADIATNAFYFVVFTDSAANPPGASVNCRIRFIDN